MSVGIGRYDLRIRFLRREQNDLAPSGPKTTMEEKPVALKAGLENARRRTAFGNPVSGELAY